MEAKHTPGPWHTNGKVHETTIDGFRTTSVAVSMSEVGRAIACVYAGFGDGPDNARLIAAAPDMLAALREFVEAFNGDHDAAIAMGLDVALGNARAAIAKAEGE
jgi:hypothetical protein